MMKARRFHIFVWVTALLSTPARLLADFSLGEIPQYAQDQAPNWLFQLLSAILIAISQLFFGGLFGTAG